MQTDEGTVQEESCGSLPTSLLRNVIHLFLVVVYLSTNSLGQLPNQTLPQAPSASQQEKAPGSESPQMHVITFLQKGSVFFPDLATSRGPLSAGEKFKLFLDDSIAPSTVLGAAFSSTLTQAADTPDGFRQGWDGYGKRFGSAMARRTSSEFFGTFVLASALHQDPRFFPQLNPTLGSSAKYAIARVFVTRNDQGKDVANWSQLIGMLLSESLANAYWPEQNRTAGQTLGRFGLGLGTRAAGNLFRNYWPSIFKDLQRVTPGLHERQD
jgi:hypothetical protein